MTFIKRKRKINKDNNNGRANFRDRGNCDRENLKFAKFSRKEPRKFRDFREFRENRDFRDRENSRFLSRICEKIRKNREFSMKIRDFSSWKKSSDCSARNRVKFASANFARDFAKIAENSRFSRKTRAHSRSKFGQFWPNFALLTLHPSQRNVAVAEACSSSQTPHVPRNTFRRMRIGGCDRVVCRFACLARKNPCGPAT